MTQTLSKRGPRDTKRTVLVPASMIDDLRALRASTFQSTGDLVNELLEIALAAHPDAVAEGRELLAAERDRKARALSRAMAAPAPEDDAPSGSVTGQAAQAEAAEPSDRPRSLTMEDVAEWAAESTDKEARRRMADGSEFVKWLIVEGRAGTLKDADDFAAMYRSRHPGQSEGTVTKHEGRYRSLARWWAKRRRSYVAPVRCTTMPPYVGTGLPVKVEP